LYGKPFGDCGQIGQGWYCIRHGRCWRKVVENLFSLGQQEIGFLDQLFDVLQEARGWCAVGQAMVEDHA